MPLGRFDAAVEGQYDAAIGAFLGEDGADPTHVTPALRKPIRTAYWGTRKVVDRAQGPAGADGADGTLSDPPQASGAAMVVVAAAASASGRVSVQLNVRSGDVALHGLDPRLDLLRAPTASGWWGVSYNHKARHYPWRVDCATDIEHSSTSREG